MPEVTRTTESLVHVKRARALDQLQNLSQRYRLVWGNEHVNVIGHHDGGVQRVADSVTATHHEPGLRMEDDQNTLKAGPREPALLEDFISAKRSRTSITNASPSAWSLRAVPRRTACFRFMTTR